MGRPKGSKTSTPKKKLGRPTNESLRAKTPSPRAREPRAKKLDLSKFNFETEALRGSSDSDMIVTIRVKNDQGSFNSSVIISPFIRRTGLKLHKICMGRYQDTVITAFDKESRGGVFEVSHNENTAYVSAKSFAKKIFSCFDKEIPKKQCTVKLTVDLKQHSDVNNLIYIATLKEYRILNNDSKE